MRHTVLARPSPPNLLAFASRHFLHMAAVLSLLPFLFDRTRLFHTWFKDNRSLLLIRLVISFILFAPRLSLQVCYFVSKLKLKFIRFLLVITLPERIFSSLRAASITDRIVHLFDLLAIKKRCIMTFMGRISFRSHLSSLLISSHLFSSLPLSSASFKHSLRFSALLHFVLRWLNSFALSSHLPS